MLLPARPLVSLLTYRSVAVFNWVCGHRCIGPIHGQQGLPRSLVGSSGEDSQENQQSKHSGTVGLPWWSREGSALPLQGAWVRSLVRELRSRILHIVAKKTKRKKTQWNDQRNIGYLMTLRNNC